MKFENEKDYGIDIVNTISSIAQLPFQIDGANCLDEFLTKANITVRLSGKSDSKYVVLQNYLTQKLAECNAVEEMLPNNPELRETYDSLWKSFHKLSSALEDIIVLGTYFSEKRIIEIYIETIEKYAEERKQPINTVIATTFIHEAMHAHFDFGEKSFLPYIPEEEEKLAEAGMLCFFDMTAQNELLSSAKEIVKSKLGTSLDFYGQGYNLFENWKNGTDKELPSIIENYKFNILVSNQYVSLGSSIPLPNNQTNISQTQVNIPVSNQNGSLGSSIPLPNNQTNISLTQVFQNVFFRIPEYQRGYAWTDIQRQDLWDDLEDIQQCNGIMAPHYTGCITLVPTSPMTDSEVKYAQFYNSTFYDVVDGQQRLTTIVILLNELLAVLPAQFNRFKDSYIVANDPNFGQIYRLEYKNPHSNNNQFLLNKIYGNPNTLPTQDNVYTKNLQDAKNFFSYKIAKLSQADQIVMFNKIIKALWFDVKYVGNNLDVQAVFETMNNRGKPLTVLEKLKNRLMFLAAKQGNVNLSNYVSYAWGIIYNKLGQNANNPLNEDEFLSAHLTLWRIPQDDVYSELLAEGRLFKMFCSHPQRFDISDQRKYAGGVKESAVTPQKIRSYATHLAIFVQSWYNVYFPDTKMIGGEHARKIQYLDGSKNMKILLAQLDSMSAQQPTLVLTCLQLIELLVFRNTIGGAGVSWGNPPTLARNLYNGSLSLTQFATDLNNYAKAAVTPSSIVNFFKGLFDYERGGRGFYRWSGCQYFLTEWEDKLRKSVHPKAIPHIHWNQYKNTSIEHIMPQAWNPNWNAEMQDYQNKVVAKNFGRALTQQEIHHAEKVIINTLGNLTIMQGLRNHGNGAYATKQSLYVHGCYSEVEVSMNTQWTYSEIQKRGLNMLNYLCDLLNTYGKVITMTPADMNETLFSAKEYVP